MGFSRQFRRIFRQGIRGGIAGVIGIGLLAGCGGRNFKDYSPVQLHKEILKAGRNNDLDDADDAFLEMEGQYPNSPYVPIDALGLALLHGMEGEYQLAGEYLDIYKKRFADRDGIEWAEYQKVKFLFKSYVNPYTDEELLKKILGRAGYFLRSYPNSPYRYEVATIWVKTKLTLLYLNHQIDNLYKKLGDSNTTIYNGKIPPNSQPPDIPVYKKVFYW